MARVLIVGGGRRGVRLAELAGGEGHAVRIVTRSEERRAEIEAAGAECWIGDPDRLGTLRGALEGVTIACWLLGRATGREGQLDALHGARLRAFLESAIDTTLRGFIYEAAGPAELAATLAQGERIAREVAGRNSIPFAVLGADPADLRQWLEQARAAVESLLSSRRPESSRPPGESAPA